MIPKYDNLIALITELVSSIPYNSWSIEDRQKVYDDWLKRHEDFLKSITK